MNTYNSTLMVDGHPVMSEVFPEAPFRAGSLHLVLFTVGSIILGALTLIFISCLLATSPEKARQHFFPRYMKLSLWMRLSQLAVICFTVLATVGFSEYYSPGNSAVSASSAELCFGYRLVDLGIVTWRSFGLFMGEIVAGISLLVYNSPAGLMCLLFFVCVNAGFLTLGLNYITCAETLSRLDGNVLLKLCIPFISLHDQTWIGIPSTLFFLAGIAGLVREGHQKPALSVQSGDIKELLSDYDNPTNKIQNSRYVWFTNHRTELCAFVFVWLPAVCEFILYLSGPFSLGDIIRCVLRTVILCVCNVFVGIATWYCSCHSMSSTSIQKIKLVQTL